MQSRSILALPVSVVLAATLAACGGGSATADESPAPVPTKTASATPTPTVEVLSATNLVSRLDGALKAQTSYDMTLDMTGAATFQGTASMQVVDGAQNMAMRMSMPEVGDMEVRFVGGMAYLKIAMLGEQFFQIDPNDASNPLAADFGGMTEQFDTGLSGMEEAITSVEPAGPEETIDGVTVQPYTVVVDTTKMTGEAAAKLAEAESVAELPATLTYTYWVGADDLVRKVSYELVGMTTTMTFTNFGAGTPVTAPAPEQITTEMPF
ncbi:hypothetical protein OMK64_08985 [Cellulomonas fimi]|uniref:hypothetical protein n=1 Tax=Cellulomonas fimi TaxID=1708 RepID=UPI00234DBBE5|nr:hypothetical protein [Cellulomonas fimi]MDC7121670.1 hypothetical protein [Cellulomonas fimi]